MGVHQSYNFFHSTQTDFIQAWPFVEVPPRRSCLLFDGLTMAFSRSTAFFLVVLAVLTGFVSCIQELDSIVFPHDTSNWISAGSLKDQQLWFSQTHVHRVQVTAKKLNVLNSLSIPMEFRSSVYRFSFITSSGFTFVFSPVARQDTLVEVQVEHGVWKQIRELSLPVHGSTWASLLSSSNDNMFLVSKDYIVSVSYSDWKVLDVITMQDIGIKTAVGPVSGASLSEIESELYVALRGIKSYEDAGVLVCVPFSREGKMHVRDVTYFQQSMETFFTIHDGYTPFLYWTLAKDEVGAIYGYDLSLRALQSTEIEFNAPSWFSSALAVNKEGDAALLASSHKHSSGYTLHEIDMVSLKQKETLYVSEDSLPETALQTNGLAVFGSKKSGHNKLSVFAFHNSKMLEAPEDDFIHLSAIQIGRVGSLPNTCTAGDQSCGPSEPCQQEQSSCYLYNGQFMCCQVSPFSSTGSNEEVF